MTFLHLMASLPSVVRFTPQQRQREGGIKMISFFLPFSFFFFLLFFFTKARDERQEPLFWRCSSRPATKGRGTRLRMRMRGRPDCAPTGDAHRREVTRCKMDPSGENPSVYFSSFELVYFVVAAVFIGNELESQPKRKHIGPTAVQKGLAQGCCKAIPSSPYLLKLLCFLLASLLSKYPFHVC